jgi:hypothetical protein
VLELVSRAGGRLCRVIATAPAASGDERAQQSGDKELLFHVHDDVIHVQLRVKI